MQECEARINVLRKKKDGPTETAAPSTDVPSENEPEEKRIQNQGFPAGQHIELFADYQDKITTAKPMDEEKRLEQEKYEKQIGYLTYLGQDTNEALGTRNWYDSAPKRKDAYDEDGRKIEVGFKTKERNDPMRIFLAKTEQGLRSTKPAPPVVSATATAEATTGVVKEPATDLPAVKRLKYTPIMPAIKRKRSDSDDEHRRHKRSKKDKSKDKDRRRDKKVKKDKNKRRDKERDGDKEKHKKKKKKHSKETRREDKEGSHKVVTPSKTDMSDKSDTLALLREIRLRREAEEKLRASELLQAKFPAAIPTPVPIESPKQIDPLPYVKQKYNSQFNPDFFRK